MPKPLQIRISPDDVSRIIEAIDYYLNSWKEMEGYYRYGVIYDGPIHGDCDAQTAQLHIRHFTRLLRRLHRELDCLGNAAKD